MIPCDTSALVALMNAGDPSHTWCVCAAAQLPPEPLLMTQACLVEAMYFLGKLGGIGLQKRLWALWESGRLVLHCSSEEELRRMRELMDKYSDVPMDFADASIVAAAEALGITLLFSLDSDFHIYKIHGRESFTIVPE